MTKRGLTRERLADIAHDYVSEHGLDALTMRRLAAAAEVTPGALYKHVRDRKDLQRAMADTVFRAVDLSDLDVGNPDVAQTMICCQRIRAAMLRFREGGRVVAGSYSPSPETIRVSSTLMALLRGVLLPQFGVGEIVLVLRSYITGFVIEEQAYLELSNAGEWESLVARISTGDHVRPEGADDVLAIMTGDRDVRFTGGLRTVLHGKVRDAANLAAPLRI
ncbi:TetR/AcrR family transcriptional regulator C-terminal domain-containing protein [Nocardia sp. CDC186]|uniref:TetR/AcrR family transcriptional regulator C-terminal domain-containing protein n=1 Tax=Nocardia implantans TaxID=3108168 RepID=A0ABU6B495_9NOCA|nr:MULTISPECIES: TetR/AcrR family transcriptional regulator C-terminal domain-containing protein [unclassified Nocardia]MBF6196261.1 TetR/AcrR family transcriptional regulator C-terminal domain-containing protein [Nocardia beijingensis]MEA3527775.1 TetR/AcrR family transcriptional regulator C-terminal domain-containing protein [Nocardia sp. CDC192]MEB3514519.1 TetR/AcrR family transcriptional regulator C-terminal domain-containing protein [Nocardia sp. CDC186]